jgi:hypothetical protein
MVVSPQRFSKRKMLHFLGGAVAAQRLAVAMEHKRNTCLCAQAAKQPHGHPIRVATKFSSAVASKSIHHGSSLHIFE